jgi:hypothetical protein
MGTYLNPGNSGFARIINSDYVDKTGLIGVINGTIGTTKNLTCISRPRRFGKSYAAQMLCAYYDKTCDSHELFETGYLTPRKFCEILIIAIDKMLLETVITQKPSVCS